MTETPKTLGQACPDAGEEAALYTAPTCLFAMLRSVDVCNQNATAALVRIRIAVANADLDPKQYVEYDTRIPSGYGSVSLLKGYPLQATDVVYVYSDIGGVSFTASGDLVTAS